MPSNTNSLTLQLLAWIASGPRTYAETMDAWRSTCPRLTVWEDALADGLVQVDRAGSAPDSLVCLTAEGAGLIARASQNISDHVTAAPRV